MTQQEHDYIKTLTNIFANALRSGKLNEDDVWSVILSTIELYWNARTQPTDDLLNYIIKGVNYLEKIERRSK